MDTTDLVVNHRAQRQPVETRVDTFPHNGTQLVAEAMLALPEKRPIAVVLLPAVDLRRRRGMRPLDAVGATPLDVIDASMAYGPYQTLAGAQDRRRRPRGV